MNDIIHSLSVTQYVRLEKKARSIGKSVPEYLVFLLDNRVGTTLDREELKSA